MYPGNVCDLSNCKLCPRECGANRRAGQTGLCGCSDRITAARAALLYYEEPCICGNRGSGAVFFRGCGLGCVFCQNEEISHCRYVPASSGEITPGRLRDIFFELEQQGAVNINLVTAGHFLPLILPALESARRSGLSIPIVYNTSSYEKPESLRLLDGLIDIYLPDLKFHDSSLSRRWCGAADYWDRASAAVAEMVRQCPRPLFGKGTHPGCRPAEKGKEPLMRRGVLVRHLVMPGQISDSMDILFYLHETYGDSILISIMNQYTPMPQCAHDPLLSRPVTQEEYDTVVDYALLLGIENGFIQEGGTISESFIPAWDNTGLQAVGPVREYPKDIPVNNPLRPDISDN